MGFSIAPSTTCISPKTDHFLTTEQFLKNNGRRNKRWKRSSDGADSDTGKTPRTQL
jgi:hypothetical protein